MSEKCIIEGVSLADAEEKVAKFITSMMDEDEEIEFLVHLNDCSFCNELIDKHYFFRDIVLELEAREDPNYDNSKRTSDSIAEDESNDRNPIAAYIREAMDMPGFDTEQMSAYILDKIENDDLKSRLSYFTKQAERCCNLGKYEMAAELYKKLFNIEPSPALIEMIAATYDLANKIDEGIQCLEDFLKKRPDDIDLLYYLGFLYERNHMLSRAENYYLQALKINSDDIRILYNLGYCYFNQKKFKEAEIQFEKAMILNPEEPNIISAVSILYASTEKINQSKELLERAKLISPNDSSVLNAEYIVSMKLEDFDNVIYTLNKSLSVFPKSGEIHNNLAVAYLEIGNVEKSREHIKIARNLRPDSDVIIKNFEAINDASNTEPSLAFIYSFSDRLSLNPT
jgi:tetratricopeptide (TPR) repeat protein